MRDGRDVRRRALPARPRRGRTTAAKTERKQTEGAEAEAGQPSPEQIEEPDPASPRRPRRFFGVLIKLLLIVLASILGATLIMELATLFLRDKEFFGVVMSGNAVLQCPGRHLHSGFRTFSGVPHGRVHPQGRLRCHFRRFSVPRADRYGRHRRCAVRIGSTTGHRGRAPDGGGPHASETAADRERGGVGFVRGDRFRAGEAHAVPFARGPYVARGGVEVSRRRARPRRDP